ncbi:hypothetical protein LG634_06115 [Streptomyces bambusae]|uniref:hypothetical protein n=1 Tax=Streptomyces bambusae TaxID=1550616 RepID=UPI001CFDDE18|nr:hypothetical protein [Streptomyces bambusae]MCB5164409.1 hypothetical protein [Streptomyces bambusae]
MASAERTVFPLELRPKSGVTGEDVKKAVARDLTGATHDLGRFGNVSAVRLLHDHADGRHLLLVSTDGSWTPDATIESLGAITAIDRLGSFHFVGPAPLDGEATAGGTGPGLDLGNDIRLFELHPNAGRTADDLAEAVGTQLVTLLDAPPTRAGNVLNVSLLREDDADRHLLFFGVDNGTSRRNESRLAALRDTMDVKELGSFIQQPL